MKILTLNFNLKGIGTYGRSFYFSRELARHGHDVTMVTVAPASTYRAKVYYKRDFLQEHARPAGEGPWFRVIEGANLGYTWLPGWGSGPLDIAGRIREILRGHYDVVYGFEYHPNVSWPVYATRLFRRYSFFSDWCDWFAGSSNRFRGWRLAHKLDGFLEERIRHLARKVTVTSKVLWQRARAIGIPETQIVHIPQGIDPEYYQMLPQEEMRKRLGFPLHRPMLGAVNDGDMQREVRIFRHVLRQMPDTLFVILGKIQKKAQALAQQLEINDSIHWAGWVSDEDYPRYIACADACFLPLEDNLNNRARWPAKILDFLSGGRPVVTNSVGEVGPLFEQRDVGLLAGQSDEEFARGILTLLKDGERCRFLGQNARRVMVEEWDWKLRGEQIAQVVGG